MRHYKARIEVIAKPENIRVETTHAMEIWFQSNNIIDAAKYVHDVILPLGFDNGDVTKLIDITDHA
jgi:hypothetical protein